MSLIPSPLMFRFAFPVQKVDRLPRSKPPLIKLPKSTLTPCPSAMEAGPQFADLSLGWNERGLAISVTIKGKSDWPKCSPDKMSTSDGIQLWLDTRNTQNIHRASRYCHFFLILPIGEGDDGLQPVIKQIPIARAGEEAPEVDLDSLLLESTADESGYTLSVWFPSGSLHGFDPETYSSLGFYLVVQDDELGRQHLTLDDDFSVQNDPSLWTTLNLESE